MTEELFAKFSASRTPCPQDFPAGKMFILLQDPFGLWCNFHAPKEAAVEEPNLYEHLRGKTDKSNRDAWIYAHCQKVTVICGSSEGEKFKKTLEAMARGDDGIIGGVLWDLRQPRGVYGSVNLLFKVNEGKSVFGDYHYKIVQLKRAGELKEHYSMQTALMNNILAEIQNYNHGSALFILKEKEQILDCVRVLPRALEYVAQWHDIRENKLLPEAKKPPKAALPPWRVYANEYVFKNKDLVLFPHLSAQMRKVLRDNGLATYEDVYKAGLEKIKEILKEPVADEALAVETYAHALAYHENMPVKRDVSHWPPSPKKRNLYFDFEATETFTAHSISFVYLIGIWDKEADKFVYFVAKDESEEKIIFKQFADYVGQDDAVLYHWTEYEVKKMRSLCEKYPDIKTDLEKLVSLCVDLKIAVEKAFYLPAPSLSLKAAAPAFGFRWRQDDCGAMDSMVYFTNWLKTGNKEQLDKVLMYNEDDCKAMLFVENYLNDNEVLSL